MRSQDSTFSLAPVGKSGALKPRISDHFREQRRAQQALLLDWLSVVLHATSDVHGVQPWWTDGHEAGEPALLLVRHAHCTRLIDVLPSDFQSEARASRAALQAVAQQACLQHDWRFDELLEADLRKLALNHTPLALRFWRAQTTYPDHVALSVLGFVRRQPGVTISQVQRALARTRDEWKQVHDAVVLLVDRGELVATLPPETSSLEYQLFPSPHRPADRQQGGSRA